MNVAIVPNTKKIVLLKVIRECLYLKGYYKINKSIHIDRMHYEVATLQ